jgi:hypothetical protein
LRHRRERQVSRLLHSGDAAQRPLERLGRSHLQWLLALCSSSSWHQGARRAHSISSFAFPRLRRPLHVARPVGPAALQGYDVIDDVARGGAGSAAGRRARVRPLKGAALGRVAQWAAVVLVRARPSGVRPSSCSSANCGCARSPAWRPPRVARLIGTRRCARAASGSWGGQLVRRNSKACAATRPAPRRMCQGFLSIGRCRERT